MKNSKTEMSLTVADISVLETKCETSKTSFRLSSP